MKKHLLTVLLLVLLLLLAAGGALAAASASYSMPWHVLSAGGAPAESSSGDVSLNGTLGQTAIGSSSGSHTSIWAGFWHSLGEVLKDLFMPLIRRAGQP